MATLIIKSNAGTVANVLIPDVGIEIPLGGGQDTFTENDELFDFQASQDLRDFLVDDAFGAGSSTLILNDGVVDIDQTDALNFLDTLVLPDISNDFGVVKSNATGQVDDSINFDGTATITNLPDPTQPTDAATKNYVDQQTAGARTFKELVFVCDQLDSVNDAISQAIPFWLANNAADGDTLTITDGVTTETFTFLAAPAVAFDVQIGGDLDATLTNLAAQINTDSTLWSASAETTLTEFNTTVTAIYRTDNSAQDSFDDRIFGTFATPADAQYINFNGELDYTSSLAAQLPGADPGQKEFGFGRATANLIANETHACRDDDTLSTWDADTGMWQNTGANNPLLEDSRYVGKWITFGVSRPVPGGSGVRFLNGAGDVPSSAAGLTLLRNGRITGASVRVEGADATRDYKVSIKINGTEVGLLALAATNASASTTALAISYSANDELSVSLERTSGTGRSTFRNATVILETNEVLN